MKRLAPLAALALACACAGTRGKGGEPPPAPLVVEGWAPAEGRDDARAAALDDARREAVAKTLRALLAPSELEGRAEELSRLLARAAEYSSGERVLDEGRQGRYYKVKLEEGLLFSRLLSDLRALGLGGKARETEAPALGLAVSGPAQASEELGRLLGSQGLAVAFLGPDLPAETELLLSSAAALARGRGLRAVVAGQAETRPADGVAAGGFVTREARLSLWLLDPERGALIASASQRASAGGGSEDIAAGKALSSAAEAAAVEIAPAALKRLRRPKRLALRLSGLSGVEELQKLMDWLRTQPETQDAAVESFLGASAELSVGGSRLSSDALAALMLRQPGVKYDIRGVSADAAELERK